MHHFHKNKLTISFQNSLAYYSVFSINQYFDQIQYIVRSTSNQLDFNYILHKLISFINQNLNFSKKFSKQQIGRLKTMFQQQKSLSPNRMTILSQQITILPNNHDEDTISSLKDNLISFEFRIKTLENQLNSKMERQQCFTLLDRKSNLSNVKKGFEQIYSKIEADRLKDEGNLQKIENDQKKKLEDLKKKLKQNNYTRQGTQLGIPLGKDNTAFNFQQSVHKKTNKKLVRPQQLYLESSQTMFSMLIDQIKQLKQRESLIERLIQSKHKKTISLNNEVCRKLENLQIELQETIKYINNLHSNNLISINKKVENSINYAESKRPIKKSTSKSQKQNQQTIQKFERNLSQTEAFQTIRLELLSKSMENMQKQLSQKLNIKDVIPFIKQNIPNFEQSMHEVKAYVEQNFGSMRRILENQSEINEQISKSNRVAWWHCYEKLDLQESQRSSTINQLGYILFSKQIMNIIPQSLVVEKDQQHTLKVLNKGWYLIHAYELESGKNHDESATSQQQPSVWIEVNNGIKYPINDKKLLNLASQTELRIITSKDDIFFQVQKL